MKYTNASPIKVDVQVQYLPEQSNEAENRFVFSYTITLSNLGSRSVTLRRRHWLITDSNQHLQEVKGKGVVGEQPTINPGESFEYTSGTVLNTQVGVMSGNYQMELEDGTPFDTPIPQFVLSIPRVLH